MVTKSGRRVSRRRTPPGLGALAVLVLLGAGGAGTGVTHTATHTATPTATLTVTNAAAERAVPDKGSPGATPCAASAKACMDVASGRAWLTDGAGHITYGPVPAHGGSAKAPTPKGTFHVLSKDAHFYSTQFHAPMPYSVFFYPGDAFHADNPATASNGCIHLSMAAAQRFFNTLKVGDQVQVK